jgi:hypothetical protein
MAISRRENGGGKKAEVMSVSHMDALRGKRLGAGTPLFLDDGQLKKLTVVLLKHLFGVPAARCWQKLEVRYEHAELSHDCARGGADNPFDKNLAESTEIAKMTADILVEIITEAFDSKISGEDLLAVLRRVSLLICLPCPKSMNAPQNQYVCYTSLPNRAKQGNRDLSHFIIQGHFMKPENKDVEEILKEECRWPAGYEKNLRLEQIILEEILSGTGQVCEELLREAPVWADAIHAYHTDAAVRAPGADATDPQPDDRMPVNPVMDGMVADMEATIEELGAEIDQRAEQLRQMNEQVERARHHLRNLLGKHPRLEELLSEAEVPVPNDV